MGGKCSGADYFWPGTRDMAVNQPWWWVNQANGQQEISDYNVDDARRTLAFPAK